MIQGTDLSYLTFCMGWNLSAIIVSNVQYDFDETLVRSLLKVGFKFGEELPEETFDSCMFPSDDTLYFGFYKNNLIICQQTTPMLFFSETINNFEKALMLEFPASEIGAFSLFSTINHFAFALLKNNIKIRLKGGDSHGERLEFGNPIEQEYSLLSRSTMINGDRIYHINGKSYTEDQIGENIVSDVWSRFTGKNLVDDGELLDVSFAGFRMSLSKER